MVRNALGTTAGTSGYSVFLDVNGDGMIISNDRIIVRNQLGMQLPDGVPVVPQSLVASGTSQAIAPAETPSTPPTTEQITLVEEGPMLTEISETNTVIAAPVVAEQTTSIEESSAITEPTASVPVIATSAIDQMTPSEGTLATTDISATSSVIAPSVTEHISSIEDKPSITEIPDADPVAVIPAAQTQTVLQIVNAATTTTAAAVLEDNNLPTNLLSQTATLFIDESNPVALSTVPPAPELLSTVAANANPIPALTVDQSQPNITLEKTHLPPTFSTTFSTSTNLNFLSPWTLYPSAIDRALSDLNGSRLESFGTLDQTLEIGKLSSEQAQAAKEDFSTQLRTHLVQQVFKTIQKDKATEISDMFSPGFTIGLPESKIGIEILDESLMQISDELEENFTNLVKVPAKPGIHLRGESNHIIA